MANHSQFRQTGGDAPDFQLTEKQIEAAYRLQDPVARYTLLEGGSRCLGGNMVVGMTNKTLRELYIDKKPFRVNTAFLGLPFTADAQPPFMKGFDRLLRITLSNGEVLEAAPGHLVKMKGSWVDVATLSVGDALSSEPSLPVSSLGHVLSKLLAGVLRCYENIQGYRGSCRSQFRSCGVQPHLVTPVRVVSIEQNEKPEPYFDFTVPATHIYCAGGIIHHNSGKTFLTVYNSIIRAQRFPATHHLSCRLQRVNADEALWKKTRKDVMRICFPNLYVKENNSSLYMQFENGSEYWFGGLDQKEGKDNLLGREWSTIHVDEATEVPLKIIEVLRTRLAQKAVDKDGIVMSNRMWLTCNPVLKKHYLYRQFVLGEDPVTGLALPENIARRYNRFRINPCDNLVNINDEYLEMLETLSPEKRKRFLEGEWQDENGDALFRYDDINRARIATYAEVDKLDFDQVVIAVDPAGTANRRSDETGIVAIGWIKPPYHDRRSSGHYYILDDESGKYEVEVWAKKAFDLWHKWNAKCMSVIQVYESNFGGNMVELALRSASRVPMIARVTATKGKAIRAEPVAALSARGELHVCVSLPKLEEEMTSWNPESGEESPNRLDAMVWGVSYILNGKAAKRVFCWNKPIE